MFGEHVDENNIESVVYPRAAAVVRILCVSACTMAGGVLCMSTVCLLCVDYVLYILCTVCT